MEILSADKSIFERAGFTGTIICDISIKSSGKKIKISSRCHQMVGRKVFDAGDSWLTSIENLPITAGLALYSTLTVPIAPRPNCHGLYISSTYTAGCR